MSDGWLTDNSINRYSIGNRTRGLQYNQNGSLTLYIQHASPGADLEPNWLPGPEAPFYMVLRLYGPTPDVVRGKWVPPPVHRQP